MKNGVVKQIKSLKINESVDFPISKTQTVRQMVYRIEDEFYDNESGNTVKYTTSKDRTSGTLTVTRTK